MKPKYKKPLGYTILSLLFIAFLIVGGILSGKAFFIAIGILFVVLIIAGLIVFAIDLIIND